VGPILADAGATTESSEACSLRSTAHVWTFACSGYTSMMALVRSAPPFLCAPRT
jgi:hypothetical protein